MGLGRRGINSRYSHSFGEGISISTNTWLCSTCNRNTINSNVITYNSGKSSCFICCIIFRGKPTKWSSINRIGSNSRWYIIGFSNGNRNSICGTVTCGISNGKCKSISRRAKTITGVSIIFSPSVWTSTNSRSKTSKWNTINTNIITNSCCKCNSFCILSRRC